MKNEEHEIFDEFVNDDNEIYIPTFVFMSNKLFITGLLSEIIENKLNFDETTLLLRFTLDNNLLRDIPKLLNYFEIFGYFKNNEYIIEPKYSSKFKSYFYMCETLKKEFDIQYKFVNEKGTLYSDFIDKIPDIGVTLLRVAEKTGYYVPTSNNVELLKKSPISRTLLKNITSRIACNYKPLTKDDEDDIEKLKDACANHVIWDEITEIEILDDPNEYVYDFTIPGNESFAINDGVLVHNTLNSFHNTGVAVMSIMTQGVPRIIELTSVSKKTKTPGLIVHMTKEFKHSKEMAHKIASHIKYTTLGDIRNRIEVYFDPDSEKDDSLLVKDGIYDISKGHKLSRDTCQTSLTNLPWLMRIEIDKEKMLDKEVTLIEIKSKLCNWWEKKHIDSKNIRKEEKKVLSKITAFAVFSNFDSDDQPVIHIRFNVRDNDKIKDPFNRETLNDMIDYIIDQFKLKGISGIEDVPVIKDDRTVIFDDKTGKEIIDKEWTLYTKGMNLQDIRYIIGIDGLTTICNDIVEVQKVFGIEIARSRLIREITIAYEGKGNTINYQNLSLLADLMTSTGTLVSIDRHGMNKLNSDPLVKASFEKSVEQLVKASVFGETDYMKGVSSRIMAGQVVKCGTNFCDVILDIDTIKNSEYIDEYDIHRKVDIIDTYGIADDIINKVDTDIFMPE